MTDDIDDNHERATETHSIANNVNDPGMRNIFILAFFGWTPHLLKYRRGTERLSFQFFFYGILCLVDLADAIFDLILSVQTIVLGSEGAGTRLLGLLLFITTVLGRIVSGLYGCHVTKHPPPEDLAFFTLTWMEMGVWFLEDGAAILVIANSTGGMTVVQTISMWLTILCGLFYIGSFVWHMVRSMWNEGWDWRNLLFTSLPVGSFVFQSYILMTEVVIQSKDDDDSPLSGGLEIAAWIVYLMSAVSVSNFHVGPLGPLQEGSDSSHIGSS